MTTERDKRTMFWVWFLYAVIGALLVIVRIYTFKP